MKSGCWTIMWNGRDCGASKINHYQPHTKGWSSSREGDVVYIVELEGSPLSWALYCCCSVAKSCLTLWSHGLQYAKLPCPPPSPRVCPSSCPLHQWCHPTISPSVTPFSFCFNLSQQPGLFQWVNCSHQVAKVLELQLQSFQWVFRVDFL